MKGVSLIHTKWILNIFYVIIFNIFVIYPYNNRILIHLHSKNISVYFRKSKVFKRHGGRRKICTLIKGKKTVKFLRLYNCSLLYQWGYFSIPAWNKIWKRKKKRFFLLLENFSLSQTYRIKKMFSLLLKIIPMPAWNSFQNIFIKILSVMVFLNMIL